MTQISISCIIIYLFGKPFNRIMYGLNGHYHKKHLWDDIRPLHCSHLIRVYLSIMYIIPYIFTIYCNPWDMNLKDALLYI